MYDKCNVKYRPTQDIKKEQNHPSHRHGDVLTEAEVEAVGGLGGPEPHGVDCVVTVARDGAVVRHRKHHLKHAGCVEHRMDSSATVNHNHL